MNNTHRSIIQRLPLSLRTRIHELAFTDSYFATSKELSRDSVANSKCAYLYLAGPLLTSKFFFQDALSTFRRVSGTDVCFVTFERKSSRPPANSYDWNSVPFHYCWPFSQKKELDCLCQNPMSRHVPGKACGHKLAWPGDLINYRLLSIDPEI